MGKVYNMNGMIVSIIVGTRIEMTFLMRIMKWYEYTKILRFENF